jgi:hypothetical protein
MIVRAAAGADPDLAVRCRNRGVRSNRARWLESAGWFRVRDREDE